MENAIEHMNSEHKDALILILEHFAQKKSENAEILKIQPDYMVVKADDEEVKISFGEKVDEENIKRVLIHMVKQARENNPDSLLPEIKEFMSKFKTVVLATVDENKAPYATYAPFIRYGNENYIYISSIAEHYSNLIKNPELEVLFLEDENKSKLLLARTRVRFKATATKITRGSEGFEDIMDLFQESLGASFKMPRSMADFDLFKVDFKDGRYVKGFGKAFMLKEGPSGLEIRHIKGDDLGKEHAFSTK